eukprot:3574503-Pyramimonas_sp.AAC.1
MGMIKRLEDSIALDTAGGSSRALGSVCVACPNFRDGGFEALVMPETPAVISVGERCMERRFSFVWPAAQRPYLLLPHGHRVELIVEGKMPYFTLSGREVLGQWMCAVAAGKPVAPERLCCVTSGAKTCLDDVESAGGPPPRSIRSRVPLDLHAHEMIGNHGYADGRPAIAECLFPSGLDCMDTVTYFYYSPQTDHEYGWSKTPTG